MKLSATSSRLRTKRQPSGETQSALLRWQAIASIAASIAVPVVLAVVGYFVQRQLATEGLKKDYVQIATSILKENPSGQDKELRKWAVEVLDRNADIPFSANAKTSLEKGYPLVRSQFIFPTPPSSCMEPPSTFRFNALVKSSIKGEYVDIADQKQFLIDITNEAYRADIVSLRLKCLQEWASSMKKITDESNAKEYGLTTLPSTGPTDGQSVKSAP